MKWSRSRARLVGLVVAGACVLVVPAYLLVWSRSSTLAEISPDILASDFVRLEATRHVWRASKPERAVHYLSHLGQLYSLTIGSISPLTNVADFYSTWAARPVYVQREIASMSIAPIAISARTHEGIVKAFEECLRTNGVICDFEPKSSATIMTLSEGYEMREDQIPTDGGVALTPFDHPDYQ